MNAHTQFLPMNILKAELSRWLVPHAPHMIRGVGVWLFYSLTLDHRLRICLDKLDLIAKFYYFSTYTLAKILNLGWNLAHPISTSVFGGLVLKFNTYISIWIETTLSFRFHPHVTLTNTSCDPILSSWMMHLALTSDSIITWLQNQARAICGIRTIHVVLSQLTNQTHRNHTCCLLDFFSPAAGTALNYF